MRLRIPDPAGGSQPASRRWLTNEPERIARAFLAYQKRDAKRWTLANRGNRMAFAERQRALRSGLAAMGMLPLRSRRVLDVGCGAGVELARLRELGAEPSALAGVDLLPERVAAAHQRFPELDVRLANAERLEWPEETFDLVLAFTVFSSILDNGMVSNVAAEIQRVLKPGGVLAWYDFRYDNPRNPNVRGMSDRFVRSLFPALSGALKSITLVPPLSRRLGVTAPVLYPILSAAPQLRSHLLGLLVKERR